MRLFRRNYTFAETYFFRKSFISVFLNYRKIINFILVKLSRLLRMGTCLGLPFNILIEPTADCNYQCAKCEKFTDFYIDDGPIFGPKEMNFENYCKIIDDIGDTVITLRLWHYGEPFLNKDLFRMRKEKVFLLLSVLIFQF
jgi:hypothetical protein